MSTTDEVPLDLSDQLLGDAQWRQKLAEVIKGLAKKIHWLADIWDKNDKAMNWDDSHELLKRIVIMSDGLKAFEARFAPALKNLEQEILKWKSETHTREGKISSLEAQIADREEMLTSLQTRAAELNVEVQKLQDVNEGLQQQRKDIAERTQEVERAEVRLNAKSVRIDDEKADVKRQRALLADEKTKAAVKSSLRDEALSHREKALLDREHTQDSREQELNAREARINSHQATSDLQCREREIEIEVSLKNLAASSDKLSQQEARAKAQMASLDHRDKEASLRDANLFQREQAILSKERLMTTREANLTAREITLDLNHQSQQKDAENESIDLSRRSDALIKEQYQIKARVKSLDQQATTLDELTTSLLQLEKTVQEQVSSFQALTCRIPSTRPVPTTWEVLRTAFTGHYEEPIATARSSDERSRTMVEIMEKKLTDANSLIRTQAKGINQLNKGLHDAQASNTTLESSLVTIKEILLRRDREISTLTRRQGELSSIIAHHVKDIETLRKEARQLDADEVRKVVAESHDSITGKISAMLVSDKNSSKNLFNELDKRLCEIQDLQSRLQESQTTTASKEAQLGNDLQQARAQVGDLSTLLSTTQDMLKQNQDSLIDVESSRASLQASCDDFRLKFNVAEQSLADAQQRNQSLSQSMTSLQQQQKVADSEYCERQNALKMTLESTEQSLRETNTDNLNLRTKLEITQQALNDTKKDKLDLTMKLEQSLRDTIKDNSSLKIKLEAAEQSVKELNNENLNLSHTIMILQQQQEADALERTDQQDAPNSSAQNLESLKGWTLKLRTDFTQLEEHLRAETARYQKDINSKGDNVGNIENANHSFQKESTLLKLRLRREATQHREEIAQTGHLSEYLRRLNQDLGQQNRKLQQQLETHDLNHDRGRELQRELQKQSDAHRDEIAERDIAEQGLKNDNRTLQAEIRRLQERFEDHFRPDQDAMSNREVDEAEIRASNAQTKLHNPRTEKRGRESLTGDQGSHDDHESMHQNATGDIRSHKRPRTTSASSRIDRSHQATPRIQETMPNPPAEVGTSRPPYTGYRGLQALDPDALVPRPRGRMSHGENEQVEDSLLGNDEQLNDSEQVGNDRVDDVESTQGVQLIQGADGSRKALLPVSQILQEGFDPSPLPNSVFDIIKRQVSVWEARNHNWKKMARLSTRRNCGYSRTYAEVSDFNDGNDFRCRTCKEHNRQCFVLINPETVELLPRNQRPKNCDVGDQAYWTG